jgi:hypothetical protein
MDAKQGRTARGVDTGSGSGARAEGHQRGPGHRRPWMRGLIGRLVGRLVESQSSTRIDLLMRRRVRLRSAPAAGRRGSKSGGLRGRHSRGQAGQRGRFEQRRQRQVDAQLPAQAREQTHRRRRAPPGLPAAGFLGPWPARPGHPFGPAHSPGPVKHRPSLRPVQIPHAAGDPRTTAWGR